LAALLVLLAPAAAKKPPGENVHRPDVECRTCHTVDRAQLDADRKAAKSALAGDLEARCMLCHGDEGPSHHTGIRPQKPVPDTLPLSAEGLITCATCHFVHGEQNPFGKLVRLDNSRGGLCLACHELADLQ
jgi:predicted CXXCH cytochrome family protein